MTRPTIGWIGLGHMGAPMAANLVAAGFSLVAYNRTRETAERLGLPLAESLEALARQADVIVTMLGDDTAQEAVLFGKDGLAQHLREGQLVINMGTMSVDLSRSTAERLAAHGVACLDAPVSGSVKQATDATLVILVGGEAAALERGRPVLDKLGKKVVHFGDVGKGAQAKLAINLMLGIVMQGLAEAVVFGEACGLESETLLEAIGATALASPVVAIKLAAIRAGNFDAAFPLKHMAKDLRLASREAHGAGAAIPATEVVRGSFELAVTDGLGDLDVIGILQSLRS